MSFCLKTFKTVVFDKEVEIKFPDLSEIKGAKFSILLGKNGSGKSRVLRNITKLFNDGSGGELFYYLKNSGIKNEEIEYVFKSNIKLIAVTSIMSDRFIFPQKNKNEKYFYNGPKVTPNSSQIYGVINRIVHNIHLILENPEKINVLKEFFDIYNFKYEFDIEFGIYNHKNRVSEFGENDEFYLENEKKYRISINLDENKFEKEIKKLKRLNELQKIKESKKRVIQKAELKITPNNSNYFYLETASSGQLTIMLTILSILTHIDNNTVILIDEPETSLHPNWQLDFINNLNKLFYNWDCHFIIASHSSFIVSDLNPINSNIFLVKDGELELYKGDSTYGWNIENILRDVFDTTISRSKYVYEIINEVLVSFQNNKKISTDLKQQIETLEIPNQDPLFKILKVLKKNI